jgi:hypothetical protein
MQDRISPKEILRRMWSDLVGWTVTSIVAGLLMGLGIGVMSMAPPAFRIAQWSFTLAALVFLSRLSFSLASSTATAERITLTVLLFAVGGVCWVELLRWVDSRMPQPAFGDSPALTHVRRGRIASEYRAICDYLKRVGFDMPYPIAPIQLSQTAHAAVVGNPRSPYGDAILLNVNLADDASAIRRVYARYIFHRLLKLAGHDLGEHVNRWEAADTFGEYFADSYSGRLPASSSRWSTALWKHASIVW